MINIHGHGQGHGQGEGRARARNEMSLLILNLKTRLCTINSCNVQSFKELPVAYALLNLLFSTIAVFVTASILPGIHVNNWGTALVVAVVLGLVNTFLRPILFLLTLPINILTLGLFSFVIIGLLVLLVSAIVPGFKVDGFWWAVLFALVLAVINNFLGLLIKEDI